MPTKVKFKKGDKIIITSGKYAGQTATITAAWSDGGMVERDVQEERRFCPVQFIHMQKYDEDE